MGDKSVHAEFPDKTGQSATFRETEKELKLTLRWVIGKYIEGVGGSGAGGTMTAPKRNYEFKKKKNENIST